MYIVLQERFSLDFIDSSPSQAILLFLGQQPGGRVLNRMCIRILKFWLGSIEGMRLGQFPLQIFLVDLFRVPILVHVQVEGLANREIRLVTHEGRWEIVLVDGLGNSWREINKCPIRKISI